MSGDHEMVLSDNAGQWEVACSCGWDSDTDHVDPGAAIDDWDNHCDVVFMEATMQGEPDGF